MTFRTTTLPLVLRAKRDAARSAYMLTEVLVYIGLVFVLLGIAYAAMYRAVDNSVALRRNADDIIGALHAGERWRADVRGATSGARWVTLNDSAVLQLESRTNQVEYRFMEDAVYRRTGTGNWSRILQRVKSSSMEPDRRATVVAWRWELELVTPAHGSYRPGRVRPLFTFLAVPPVEAKP